MNGLTSQGNAGVTRSIILREGGYRRKDGKIILISVYVIDFILKVYLCRHGSKLTSG